jgi:protein arginine kinase activator
MKCLYCSSLATVHVTRIIDKQKCEMHVCEACAREKNLIPEPPQELNVPALLNLVLGQLPMPTRPATLDSTCPACGTPYAHFRAQGRLGCPHDYEFFRPMLEPLLEKVHNGCVRHVGKTPGRLRRRLSAARRQELEAELKVAVRAERYEEAARLRDEIRKLGEGQ